MVKYLSMDGVDDYISLPQFSSITDIYFDVSITDNTDGDLYCNKSGNDLPEIYWNGTSLSGNGIANLSPTTGIKNIRTNIHAWGTAWGTFANGTIGRLSWGSDLFLKMDLYGVKIYNGASLIASYDMSTGTVQDQSGNGKHATLTGGTWLDDGTGGTIQTGAATILGMGTLSASSLPIRNSQVTLQGTGLLTASSIRMKDASVTLQGQGLLTGAPLTMRNGQSSLLGQGLLLANGDHVTGVVFKDGTVQLIGQGAFTSSGVQEAIASALLTGQGMATINSIREALSSATFIGSGVFVVDIHEILIVDAEANLFGSGVFLASGIDGLIWHSEERATVPMYAIEQESVNNWKEPVITVILFK